MGLNDKEVLELRKKYGSNEITRKKGSTFFKILLEYLSDPIIKILLIALSIKIVFLFKNFDWYETLGIVIAIFLASFKDYSKKVVNYLQKYIEMENLLLFPQKK